MPDVPTCLLKSLGAAKLIGLEYRLRKKLRVQFTLNLYKFLYN
jgi:hypothetical protein